MLLPNTGVAAALFVAGALCFLGGIIALQTRNHATGASSLITLMFSLCWWDVTYGLFLANTPALYSNFWLHVVYIGVVFTPPSVLWFVMQILGLTAWSRPPFVISLYAISALVLTLVITDSRHGLFFGGREITNAEMILSGGPIFWANLAYSYTLMLTSLFILTHRFRKATGIYRKQLGIILLGVGIPWISNLIFVSGLSPLPKVDTTPLSFTVTGMIFTYALLRFRLLEIIPIARDVLIENMSDGVIVLDSQNRLVDFNPAALQSLELDQPPQMGQPASEIFAKWAELAQDFSSVNDVRVELTFDQPVRAFLDLKISSLYDHNSNFLGRLIVWRDITPLKNAQAELQEQAIRDPLTGLYNRRYLSEALTRELARAARENYPISLALIDIDDFKRLNDEYGHPAGDSVLRGFAKQLLDQTRVEDMVYRYGGEEFLVLLPNCAGANAVNIADKWRKSFSTANPSYKNGTKEFTISCGIAEFPTDGRTGAELIAAADHFLYQAKATGKNRVVTRANR
ncbi:MAG: diguanylate cyclase [Anaerolineales bacterium]